MGVINLRRTVAKAEPIQLLLVEQPDSRTDHLTARWLSAHELALGYRDAQLDFQVVRAAGLDISTVHLP